MLRASFARPGFTSYPLTSTASNVVQFGGRRADRGVANEKRDEVHYTLTYRWPRAEDIDVLLSAGLSYEFALRYYWFGERWSDETPMSTWSRDGRLGLDLGVGVDVSLGRWPLHVGLSFMPIGLSLRPEFGGTANYDVVPTDGWRFDNAHVASVLDVAIIEIAIESRVLLLRRLELLPRVDARYARYGGDASASLLGTFTTTIMFEL